MEENEITEKIIGTAMKLHRAFGPGLLESVYETALAHDLAEIGLDAKRQVAVPFVYKEIRMEVGFRMDILVNSLVLVEVKSIEALAPVHFAQTLTYLKLTEHRVGLLMNFNVRILKDGIHRIINGY
jgi:GxxExxY protein